VALMMRVMWRGQGFQDCQHSGGLSQRPSQTWMAVQDSSAVRARGLGPETYQGRCHPVATLHGSSCGRGKSSRLQAARQGYRTRAREEPEIPPQEAACQ